MKVEVPVGFEPTLTELQSIALPLGYGTVLKYYSKTKYAFQQHFFVYYKFIKY